MPDAIADVPAHAFNRFTSPVFAGYLQQARLAASDCESRRKDRHRLLSCALQESAKLTTF
jgi:hypothetical protein